MKSKNSILRRSSAVFLALALFAGFVLTSYAAGSAGDSPLYKKSALFCGDSICDAAGDSRIGWAGRIAKDYEMDYLNAGVSGASVSNVRGEKTIVAQLKAQSGKDYDFIILHGGTNDGWDEAPVGAVTAASQKDSFDLATFAGGLEDLFSYAKTNYPDAYIGYIFNFQTPNISAGSLYNMEDYYNEARKVCAKWEVPYLDLYFDEDLNNNVLDVCSGLNVPDLIHPSSKGYDLLYPYIAAFMEDIANGKTEISETPRKLNMAGSPAAVPPEIMDVNELYAVSLDPADANWIGERLDWDYDKINSQTGKPGAPGSGYLWVAPFVGAADKISDEIGAEKLDGGLKFKLIGKDGGLWQNTMPMARYGKGGDLCTFAKNGSSYLNLNVVVDDMAQISFTAAVSKDGAAAVSKDLNATIAELCGSKLIGGHLTSGEYWVSINLSELFEFEDASTYTLRGFNVQIFGRPANQAGVLIKNASVTDGALYVKSSSPSSAGGTSSDDSTVSSGNVPSVNTDSTVSSTSSAPQVKTGESAIPVIAVAALAAVAGSVVAISKKRK